MVGSGDAKAVEASACKADLSGFESHRHLQKFESGASASSATPARRQDSIT